MRKSGAEYSRHYQKKHPDRFRRSRREYTRRKRVAVIELLGGKCNKCGFSDKRALQIDHINGGGKKELQSTGGAGYMIIVIKSILNNENKGRPILI